MLLLLLSHTGKHAATTLLACVSLMPALLDAASLLQADAPQHQADNRNSASSHLHHQSDNRNPASSHPNRRIGENPFWLDDSSSVLGRGSHSRGHHHARPRRPHRANRPAPETLPDQPDMKQTLNFADSSSSFGDQGGVLQYMQRDVAPESEARGDRRYGDSTRLTDNERRERAYRRHHTGTGTDDQNDEQVRVDDEDDEDDEDNSSADLRQDARLHGRLTPCPGCQRITDDEVAVSESGAPRPTGRKLSDAQMKDMLIEHIKQQILAKLRLPAAPNATRRHMRLPAPLVGPDPMMGDEAPGGGGRDNDPDDFYGKTTQVITFGTQVRNCPSGRSNACFHFDMSSKVNPLDVRRAQLWVYKQPASHRPQTLVFSKLASRRHNSTRVGKELGHEVVSENQHWVSFELKNTVQHWLTNPDRNLGLVVSCKTCRDGRVAPVATDPDRMPFVVIHTTANHQVYRRSTNDCGERSGNRCCREKFYVDFSLIGWDWITWPRGYSANYCKGTCFVESPILPRYQHTNVMQKYAYTTNKEELSPCCAPRRMSALSLLYTVDGEFIRKDLPNMAVESCGCT